MLATTTPFPEIGARAILRGECVTIHQHLEGGRTLVFGDRRTYRADFDELQPIPADATPARLWLLERVDASDPNWHTPVHHALADFRLYIKVHALDGDAGISQDRFRRAVKAEGGRFLMKSLKMDRGYLRALHLVGRLRPQEPRR